MSKELPTSFCIYPWVHAQIDNDGSIVTCCEVSLDDRMAKVDDGTIEDVWNSKKFKKIRKEFLKGGVPEQCLSCFKKESLGHESDRIKANNWYREYYNNVSLTNDDGSLTIDALKSIDLRVSNTCNFKCRTCTPASSTALAKEWPLITPNKVPPINKKSFSSKEKALEFFKPVLGQIEKIYCAGGEPFMQVEIFEILNYLISIGRAKDAELFYNTNLSIDSFGGEPIHKTLSKFKQVTLNLSLDDYGKRGEYIRDGLNWEVFKRNLLHFKKNLNNLETFINITVSNMNSFYLPEFIEVCLEDLKVEREKITFNPVTTPEYYHLANLPEGLKREVVKNLRAFLEDSPTDRLGDGLTAIVNMIEQPHEEKYLKVFRQVTKRIDQVRGQSFSANFPKLKNLLEA